MRKQKVKRLKGTPEFELYYRDAKIRRLMKAFRVMLKGEMGPMRCITETLLEEEKYDQVYRQSDF
jgi:hypothetical protein